jgi:hypothetical protein
MILYYQEQFDYLWSNNKICIVANIFSPKSILPDDENVMMISHTHKSSSRINENVTNISLVTIITLPNGLGLRERGKPLELIVQSHIP